MTVSGTVRTRGRHRSAIAALAAPTAFVLILAGCSSSSQSDASAVVTSAISFGLAANAYRSLAAQHIPVLIGSGGPDSPPNSEVLAIQVGLLHPSKATDLAVDEVIAQSDGKAKVLFISVTDNSVIKRE